MKGIGDKLLSSIEADEAYTAFKYFEPWDVEVRDKEVFELAAKESIDLFHPDYIKTGNIAPHPFQSGYLLSTKPIRASIGPTQGGKSIQAMIEIGCMCSGEFPISLQYNKGVDTGIERLVTIFNIHRWGRFDKETGKFLDKDATAPRDGTWNCGTIIGAGKFPKKKVIPRVMHEEKAEKIIWVGTTKKAMDESWWPKLTKGTLLPEKFIDRTKGNNGTNQSDGQHVIHLINDVRLSLISYESGFDKFEAVTVWACYFDEESKDERCLASALSHCKYFAAQMTPYNGMTYTKDIFFKPSEDLDTFHACAYDSPYLTPEEIRKLRSMYPEHEIGARIWGQHTSESKRPYYSAEKLRAWLQRNSEDIHGFRAQFMPSEPFFGMKRRPETNLPGLMDIEAILTPIGDEESEKNAAGHCIVWTIYEDLKDDVAYYLMSDAAAGAELAEDAGDHQSALVMRKPTLAGEKWPIVVAEIETTVTPDLFAQMVGLALIYYNRALLCAEASSRGAHNGMFFSEMREYPFWYERSVQKQSTNKFLTQKGVDTNVGTRKAFFDEIEKLFGEYTKEEMPPIPSQKILTMASECTRVIRGGNVRPDHPRNSPNDLLMCFGIGLFVNKHFPEQIKCRRKKKDSLERASRDSVIRLLERSAREQQPDSKFPQQHGARR